MCEMLCPLDSKIQYFKLNNNIYQQTINKTNIKCITDFVVGCPIIKRFIHQKVQMNILKHCFVTRV